MKNVAIFVTLWALSTASGCATQTTAKGGKALMQFPSREELAAAPVKELAPGAFIPNGVRVESWEIDPGAVPAQGAPADPRSDEVVKELFGAQGRATAAMSCLANELGKFQLEKGAPTEGLRRYAAGRCGVTVPLFTFAAKEVPAEATTSERFWDGVKKGLRESRPKSADTSARVEAGVALVRKGDKAVFVLVAGRIAADAEAVPPVAATQGEVVVRGSVTESAESISAIINQGSFGFAPCRPAEPVALPRFALRCPMAKGDESAWIDVLVQPPKKLLSHVVLSVMATREGARAPYTSSLPIVKSQGSFALDLLAHLNAVRAQGKLSPLTLSAEQSAVNERHAGAILSSFHDGEGAADRLALGLMAGWEIQGTIRRGDILASITSSTTEPGAWLAESLSHPLSRSVLLEPDRRVIAIGAASPSPQLGVGAVISTYALFEGHDHRADEVRVGARLNEARARRGLAPVALFDLRQLRAAADRVGAGKQDSEEALQEALDGASSQIGRPLRGMYFEATDLDAIEFPEPFLAALPPGVAVAVTHYRAAGAAWGQYVVLLALLPGAGQQQASLAAPSEG